MAKILFDEISSINTKNPQLLNNAIKNSILKFNTEYTECYTEEELEYIIDYAKKKNNLI